MRVLGVRGWAQLSKLRLDFESLQREGFEVCCFMVLVTPQTKLIKCRFQLLVDRSIISEAVVSTEQQNRAPTEIFAEA